MAPALPSTICELVRGYRSRAFSPVEVAREAARRVRARQDLNCLRWFDEERLLAEAERPRDGVLAGVPLALKDNIDTAGVPTTGGSATRLGRVPDQNAAVWDRLEQRAGALLLGKANLHEFAYSGHHPDFGVVRNPHNVTRHPGGSSSGSAAAVAAGLAPGALGTDTGGSVRTPAAYCGIVGLKPTTGLIELSGIAPLAWSLDCVGPLARTVTDAALLLEQMLPQPLGVVDPQSLTLRRPAPEALRVGVPRGFFVEGVQDEIRDCWDEAARRLGRLGCRVEEVSITDVLESHTAHRVILVSEAYTYHAEELERGAPFGPTFRAAVEMGRDVTAQMYLNALRWRRMVMDQVQRVFDRVDVVLLPTCRTTAPSLEEGDKPKGLGTSVTFLANFVAAPAISVPAGYDGQGLPIGLMLMGRPHSDATLLGAALLLEEQMGFTLNVAEPAEAREETAKKAFET